MTRGPFYAIILLFSTLVLSAQSVTIDGYVYESGNRGFLNVVQIEVSSADGTLLETVFSDLTGHFEAEVPVHSGYSLKAYKDMFEGN